MWMLISIKDIDMHNKYNDMQDSYVHMQHKYADVQEKCKQTCMTSNMLVAT